MKPEVLYVLIGVYTILHALVLTDYTATPRPSETIKLLAASQWLVPTFLLVLLVPVVQRTLRSVLRVRFWTVMGLTFALGCVILELLNIPGLWWAWSTLGLLVLVIILVANLTKDRLGHVNSLLLGMMVMFLGIGSWETLYHTGLWFYHGFFGSGLINYAIVIAEQLTWILPALIVILVLYKRYGNIVRANKVTLVCVALTVVLTTIWFVNGMQIPLVWYKGVGPFVTDADQWAISVSRGSQAFWVLGVATLFIGGRVNATQ